MAIKCGETIAISMTTKCATVYAIEIKVYNPDGDLVDTLTNPSYSIAQLDNDRYKITVLYTLSSTCKSGVWQADITIQPSADTYQKETVQFYVTG